MAYAGDGKGMVGSGIREPMNHQGVCAAPVHAQTVGVKRRIAIDVTERDKLLQNIESIEDKILITNCVELLHVLRPKEPLATNFVVVPWSGGFNLIGTISTSLHEKQVVVNQEDFDTIMSLSPARICNVSVQVTDGALELVVRITKHTTPISLTSYQIKYINRKQRLLL